MPIVNFDFPKVTLAQYFEGSNVSTTSELSVVCLGPQYQLHDVGTATEAKIDQTDTAYDPSTGLSVASIPGRTTGGTLDTDASAQHLVVIDGIYRYFLDETAANFTLTASTGVIVFNNYNVKDGAGYTAKDNFGTRGVKVGDPIILTDGTNTVTATVLKIFRASNSTGYNTITVAQGLVADLGALTKVGFCETANARYDESDNAFTISSTGALTINGGLTAKLADLSDVTGYLQAGTFYIEYRERLSQYVNKLGTVGSVTDITDTLGPINNDNPLALGCYAALNGGQGSTVYFIGVADDTVEAYAEALDYLDNFSQIYSVVPCTDDTDIIQTCMAAVNNTSNDVESTVRRALWYGIDTDSEINLWAGNGTFVAKDGTTPAYVTLSETVFIDYPLQAGDVIKLAAAPYTEYTIASTDGVSVATFDIDAAPTAGTKAVILLRTKPVNADLVTDIISKRVTQSNRAQCVWADGAMLNGEVVKNFFVAAAAAGMRAYEPVHRPLSNLGYSFFTVSEPHGFTKSQLKQIGSNGIWIVANNNDGTPINKRAITTAIANDGLQDEESIVSNVDNIAMACIQVGQDRVGCSNISPSLVAALRTRLNLVLASFTVNNAGDYVGAQVLAYDLQRVYQGEVNLDHVYADFTITVPRVFNEFNMTVRVL